MLLYLHRRNDVELGRALTLLLCKIVVFLNKCRNDVELGRALTLIFYICTPNYTCIAEMKWSSEPNNRLRNSFSFFISNAGLHIEAFHFKSFPDSQHKLNAQRFRE